MQVGVTFPQSEIGADPKAIRDYAQAAEDLGYEHLLAYDHVLGADPSNREGWRGYTHKTMFHEPLTLFCYLIAVMSVIPLYLWGFLHDGELLACSGTVMSSARPHGDRQPDLKRCPRERC